MEIQKEDLILQIKAALCDEFVARITPTENGLELTFENGQKFTLTVS